MMGKSGEEVKPTTYRFPLPSRVIPFAMSNSWPPRKVANETELPEVFNARMNASYIPLKFDCNGLTTGKSADDVVPAT